MGEKKSADEKKSGDIVERIWDIFSSMKTGLVLLGIVGIVSAIGTLIPQKALDPEGAEAVSEIWRALGFTQLYSSVWFQLILGLLCINLIVCSVQRFNGIYKQTFKPTLPKNPGNVPSKIQKKLSVPDREALRNQLINTLQAKGFKITSKEEEGKWSFVAQKRRWGNWGSLITHLAFVVLIIGALVGSLIGFKGFLWAGVGDIVPIQSIEVNKGKITDIFSVKINSAEDRILENGERDNWYTDLSILESGNEVARQTISVNHPMTYKGITFYQSSYGAGAKFTVDLNGQKFPVILQNRGANYYKAPGTDLYLIMAAMKADSKDPQILYQVYKGDSQQPLKMAQLSRGQSDLIDNTYTLTFDDVAGFTGLQVKKDPGVSVVWLGSALLMLGLILSFYWRSVTITGLLDQQGELTVGAQTGKVRLGIQEEFDRIVAELTKESSASH